MFPSKSSTLVEILISEGANPLIKILSCALLEDKILMTSSAPSKICTYTNTVFEAIFSQVILTPPKSGLI